MSVTRFALGDLRLPGLRPSPAPPVSAPDANAEALSVVAAPEGVVAPKPVAAPAPVAAPSPVAPEPRLDPELEAELAVREHLYGRRGWPR